MGLNDAQTDIHLQVFPTLQGAAQQGVELWVDLSFLLQHVEEQLVLCGAVDLSLLQPALHHLELGILLSRLQTLPQHTGYQRICHCKFVKHKII